MPRKKTAATNEAMVEVQDVAKDAEFETVTLKNKKHTHVVINGLCLEFKDGCATVRRSLAEKLRNSGIVE